MICHHNAHILELGNMSRSDLQGDLSWINSESKTISYLKVANAQKFQCHGLVAKHVAVLWIHGLGTSDSQSVISSLNYRRLQAFHRILTLFPRALVELAPWMWNLWSQISSRIPACLLLDAGIPLDISVSWDSRVHCVTPTLTFKCPCWLNASKPPPWRRWIKCLWKEATNGATWPTSKVSRNSCCAAAGWGPSCIEGTSVSFIGERFVLKPLSDINKGVRDWKLFD